MSELQFQIPLKGVQINWGGEFRSSSKFLAEMGIHHRVICPHTHHKNGVVRRKHNQILYTDLFRLSPDFQF